jgi:predicted AlkP superfamily pyrophosphatase or phosphodiesterase
MNTMLPSPPKSFGRLSDVFISALGSMTGIDNRLGLRKVDLGCVVMVDGLGVENITFAAGHMKFLGKQSLNAIRCAFPSTTASSLVSFATGDRPGVHNFVGYQVQKNDEPLNLLTGLTPNDAKALQRRVTVSEKARASGLECYFIGPPEYENSGFTNATMRDATYVAEKEISKRVSRAVELLKTQKRCLIYLYIPELDQTAHRHGSRSMQWLQRAEDVDSELSRLVDEAPKRAGILVTADHGIVDVPTTNHIYLDDLDFDWAVVQSVGGDPRSRFLYLTEPSLTSSVRQSLTDELGADVHVCEVQDLVDSGWLANPTAEARSLLPQLFLIAKTAVAIYHRSFSKPQSMKMIGQHGSISDAETRVPLVKLNGYA